MRIHRASGLVLLAVGCCALLLLAAGCVLSNQKTADIAAPLVSPAAEGTPAPEIAAAIPAYLQPVQAPLRRVLRWLSVGAIGFILALYLLLVVGSLARRR